jgi:hypothetical protein
MSWGGDEATHPEAAMSRPWIALFLLAALAPGSIGRTGDIDIRRGGVPWARIDAQGGIRIDGRLAGRFEDDGSVRRDGVLVGSIEPDGAIRRNGSLAGAVEEDGTVRRDGSIIGRIEKDGAIRKDGSLWGSADPCCADHGEMRRIAAVLVFFAPDYF